VGRSGSASLVDVPTISAFYGIVITMHWREHAPPHFHATYAGHDASYLISSAAPFAGVLPRRADRLVREWAGLHQSELADLWEKAQRFEPLGKIAPLD
jgi:hypothetical protein